MRNSLAPPRTASPRELDLYHVGRPIPAWVLSVLLHTLILSTAIVTIRLTPRGVAPQPERTAGIVLVRHEGGNREYFADTESAGGGAGAGELPPVDPLPAPTDVDIDLAGTFSVLAAGPTGAEAVTPRRGAFRGGGRPRGIGETARTDVFGVAGEGSRFVYVFDRSGSMDGFAGTPLRAAKEELVASLGDLHRVHQFQIIFYNEQPHIFNPGGGRPRLVWADSAGKELAQQFVLGITASGGTRHLDALRMALALNPDVVFFLTDADEPRLTASELADVRRLNGGAAIHAVEFGFGPQRNSHNFLTRLAQQNAGRHVYVDISKLSH